MANSFSHNKKCKIFAAAIAAATPYTSKMCSVSKLSQDQLKGKKYGKTYSIYLPGIAKVVEGTDAEPTEIEEVEAEITLTNLNTSVELSAWNSLSDMESFADEVATPNVTHLARTEEQKIIARNIFKSMQAVVYNTADYGLIGDAAAALKELGWSKNGMFTFIDPTSVSKITRTGLNLFLQNDKVFMDTYGSAAIGTYAGSKVLEEDVLPTLTTPASIPSVSISLTAVKDADNNVIGFEPVDQVSGSNLIPGLAYKIAEAKIVDNTGIESQKQNVIVIVQDSAGHIPQLRLTIEGEGFGNPNAWVPAGTDSLTLTPILEADTVYALSQTRMKEVFAFDSYKFDDIPGTDTEDHGSAGNHTVKMTIGGNTKSLGKLVRIDSPFAAGLFEPRGSVTGYLKIGTV